MTRRALVRAYFSAYESADRSALESMLTRDFVFTSPYDYRIARESYFQRCWPYSEKGPTYRLERVVEDGDAMFVLYESTTRDGGSSRNVELFALEGALIRSVEVYFGAAPKISGGG